MVSDMMSEKRLKKIVRGLSLFCIVWGLVVGVLLTAFVCDVCADEIVFDEYSSSQKTWEQTDDGHYNRHYYFPIQFTKIDYYIGINSMSWMHVELKHYEIDAWSPSGWATHFNMTVGADEIGSGLMSYSKMSDTEMHVYWYFDAWDIGSLTGTQNVVVNYNHSDIFNLHVSQPWEDYASISYTDSSDWTFHIAYYNAGYGYTPLGATRYRSNSKKSWIHIVSNETCGGYVLINITKNVSDIGYPSKCRVYTPGEEFLNETSENSINLSVAAFGFEMCVRALSLYDNEHEHCFYVDTFENAFWGYVYDVAGKFVVDGVLVEFQDETMTTSAMGFYSFESETFGEYFLNASKSGYQDYARLYNYVGTSRHDIYIQRNETVNSGTCTVAGIVYDTGMVPIDGVYVEIFNETWNTYVYTSEMGHFVFYNLTNTTYFLSATHVDYLKQQKDINLTDLDTAYYYEFVLVGVDELSEGAPTPTPTPGGSPTMDGWITIFDMLGLGDYMGLILGFVCMFSMGAGMGKVTNGNTMGVLIGCFFGYVVAVAMDWFPMWTVAVVICGSVFFVVKGVAK